jgi:hypothetical protein
VANVDRGQPESALGSGQSGAEGHADQAQPWVHAGRPPAPGSCTTGASQARSAEANGP